MTALYMQAKQEWVRSGLAADDLEDSLIKFPILSIVWTFYDKWEVCIFLTYGFLGLLASYVSLQYYKMQLVLFQNIEL